MSNTFICTYLDQLVSWFRFLLATWVCFSSVFSVSLLYFLFLYCIFCFCTVFSVSLLYFLFLYCIFCFSTVFSVSLLYFLFLYCIFCFSTVFSLILIWTWHFPTLPYRETIGVIIINTRRTIKFYITLINYRSVVLV